jgi:hypothetical protein
MKKSGKIYSSIIYKKVEKQILLKTIQFADRVWLTFGKKKNLDVAIGDGCDEKSSEKSLYRQKIVSYNHTHTTTVIQ